MGLIRFIVLLCFVCVNNYGVQSTKLLSAAEGLELEKKVKLLNKPAINTIKDEAGDMYDCVEITKQPAFDHPLLKNHKIKMRPTSPPKNLKSEMVRTAKQPDTLKEGISCPLGTVPIRRTRKEDLMKAKALLQSYPLTFGSLTKEQPGFHSAAVKILLTRTSYSGIEAYLNVLNPKIDSKDAWSSALIWIENKGPGDLNIIQAGWTVSPELYGDSQTRTFVYWQGQGNKRGCFNHLCPGYIQVNNQYPMGRPLPASKYGEEYAGEEYAVEYPLSVYQDEKTKNWWLVNQNKSINYGYFPKELFPGLVSGTPFVGWGGQTKSAPNQLSPPMGSGFFPDGKFEHTGYFAHAKVVNVSDHVKYDPDRYLLDGVTDDSKCYDVKNYGVMRESGYTIMYGGPGGHCAP